MQLIEYWKQFDPSHYPYIHPQDLDILKDINAPKHFKNSPSTYQEYLLSANFGMHDDSRMDLSLLPIPYAGDLKNSKVVIFLLNPGLHYSDYYGEYDRPEYRKRLVDNIQQDFSGVDFPFLWLDPNLSWHAGFQWWEKKLRTVIKELAERRFNKSYYEALKFASKNIAQIELIPYHSTIFKSRNLVRDLASAKESINFARTTLQADANSGKKKIIITRQVREWGVPKSKNIITYESHEARSASLGVNGAGGKAILDKLLEI